MKNICLLITLLSLSVEAQVYKLPAKIDAGDVSPYSEIGKSRVVKSSIGQYREIGNRRFDRIAYMFETENAEDLVKMTLEYPDNQDRMCEIYLFPETFIEYQTVLSAHGAGENAFASSYITGHSFTLTNKMVSETFYFYVPRGNKFTIVLMSSRDGAPGAVKSLSLERVTAENQLGESSGEITLDKRRRLGLYWEDPVLVTNFGGPQPPEREEFASALDRQVRYMKMSGQNEVIYPVTWYQGSLFQPSAEYELATWYERPHPEDFDKMMAKKYSEAGIDFWPSIRNWTLPSLRKYMWDEEEIWSGRAWPDRSVNTVTKEGEILHRNRQWHFPPQVNAIHPLTQSALKNLVSEVITRLSDEKSVQGVALFTTIHSSHGLGTTDQSYDDYTVNLFAKEQGLTLPETGGNDPDRFIVWYRWIKENHWENWLSWRRAKITKLYFEMAEIVANEKPGAKLNVMIFYPLINSGIDDVETYLSEIGIDMKALAGNPNIIITRMSKVYDYYRKLRQVSENDQELIDLKERDRLLFDKGWQKPFIGVADEVIVHYSYLESELKDLEKLDFPFDWEGVEPGWHVTHPRPTARNAISSIVKAIALYDALVVSHGGFNLGSQGMEEMIAEFSAKFCALPAIKFENVYEENGLVLRTKVVDDERWIYLLNANEDHQKVQVEFSRSGTMNELGLTQGKIKVSKSITVSLRPYDLKVWKSEPEVRPIKINELKVSISN